MQSEEDVFQVKNFAFLSGSGITKWVTNFFKAHAVES